MAFMSSPVQAAVSGEAAGLVEFQVMSSSPYLSITGYQWDFGLYYWRYSPGQQNSVTAGDTQKGIFSKICHQIFMEEYSKVLGLLSS